VQTAPGAPQQLFVAMPAQRHPLRHQQSAWKINGLLKMSLPLRNSWTMAGTIAPPAAAQRPSCASLMFRSTCTGEVRRRLHHLLCCICARWVCALAILMNIHGHFLKWSWLFDAAAASWLDCAAAASLLSAPCACRAAGMRESLHRHQPSAQCTAGSGASRCCSGCTAAAAANVP